MISVGEDQVRHPSYRDHEKQARTKIKSSLLVIFEPLRVGYGRLASA